MPKPPQFDELDEVSFITNYFIQGCAPPFALFCEFARAPQEDVWLLLLGIDFEDIVKDWLRPGKGRQRSSGRHGRKARLRSFSFDPNDYFGGKARAKYGPYPGLAIPGAKVMFHIADEVDKLNWTAAVVGGLTDIGFETLYGILSVHPEHCPNYAFVMANSWEGQDFVGVAPANLPLGWDRIEQTQHFQGPNPFTATTFKEDFTYAWSGNVLGLSFGGVENIRLTVRSAERGIIAEGYAADLDRLESVDLAISAECKAGEFVWAARSVTSGSVRISKSRLFAFAGTWL